jgi:hypothetical protein
MGVIQRVVTEESGKVFNFESDLFFLDRHNDMDYSYCKLVWSNPVKVFDDSKRLIGSVNISVDRGRVVGWFSIDYSTPERLNIQTRTPTYPHIQKGALVSVENYYGAIEMMHMEINGVTLSLVPSEDVRIKSIS